MLTQGIQVQKYVRASAGRAGISIVFEDVNEPRHDGKTIYLPRITYKTTELELKELMSSVDHEVAHDKYSCFDVLKEKACGPKSLLMFVWNFLEDSRINTIEAQEYEGFRENWDETSVKLVEKILHNTKKEVSAVPTLVTALLCWETKVSVSNFPQLELVTSKYKPNKKIMDVLSNYSDRLVHCHSILEKRLGTLSTYDLAVDILKELEEKCKDELPKPKPAKGTGEDGDVKGATSSDETDDKGGKLSDAKKGEGGKPKKDDSDYMIINMKLTDDELNKFSPSMHESDGLSKVGVNFEPVKSGDAWDLTDFEKFIVVDYPKQLGEEKFFNRHEHKKEFLKEYAHRTEPKIVSQENFAQQVRRLIQIRAKVQRVYGVKKGKLDQSRLSRICFDAPGFNERVFKNKIDNKTLDAAITVLVDMSGSMSGEKVQFALASTLLVNEVCSTLNVPVEIIGFSDVGSLPSMYIYKSFSDARVTEEQLKEYFGYSSHWMSGNPDGENILWTYDRLLKRKEKKRLMIVMSDGSPAASKGGSGIGLFTHKVIGEIERAKKIEIYGLGLCSHEVEYYYKSHSVVNEPQEIPSKLIELIERKILR